MMLKDLIATAREKSNFTALDDYLRFGIRYLDFIKTNLQAVIVAENENQYRFFQYREDGTYNVTRPINSDLMYNLEEFEGFSSEFKKILGNAKSQSSGHERELVNRITYTAQQCIGAALDALPANESNTARKVNGDLFERLVRLIISETGVDVSEGHISIPVVVEGETSFNMNYQHDLIVRSGSSVRAIGSVKTSSKDRIDKIFIDKLLYNKLTDTDTPHFAVFLNDVQRKGKEGKYGVNATFLAGHFKGYTVRLNPLDGVYYCDIRPNMESDAILSGHIKTFDHLIFSDIWKFIG